MDVIDRLIAADGVHISVKSVPDFKFVAGKRHALPFRQGLNDLRVAADSRNIKADRAFDSVQIIVQAGFFGDEQRGSDTLQMQACGELILEGVFYVGDGSLNLVNVQRWLITLRNSNVMIHMKISFRFEKIQKTYYYKSFPS